MKHKLIVFLLLVASFFTFKVMATPISANPVVINTFDDLKNELQPKDKMGRGFREFNGLTLKQNNYALGADIVIDLNDPFFDDKLDYIKYGIISAGKEDDALTGQDVDGHIDSFHFDGQNHKITIIGRNGVAQSLFGNLYANDLKVKDLVIEYDKDVLGHGFAEMLHAQAVLDENDYSVAGGMIKNVQIKVNGNILSKEDDPNRMTPWISNSAYSGNKSHNFYGALATGFAFNTGMVSAENITIDVNGNIGSDTLPSDSKMAAAAYGFTFASQYGTTSIPGTNPPVNKTSNEMFIQHDFSHVKQIGYFDNININVGGNIQANGYDIGHATGFAQSMGEMWLENIHINVANSIKVNLVGGSEAHWSNKIWESPLVAGISDDIMHLTNSTVTVKEMSMNISDDFQKNIAPADIEYNSVIAQFFGLAGGNGIGNFIKVEDNTLNVGNVNIVVPTHIQASLGVKNNWGPRKKNGFDDPHSFERNVMNVENINIKTTKEDVVAKSTSNKSQIQYDGIGKKFRTGVMDDFDVQRGTKALEEVAAKNNVINVKNLKVDAAHTAYVGLLLDLANNAKDNTVTHGNIDITAKYLAFNGLGNLLNESPTLDNGIFEITEGNTLVIDSLTLKADEANSISLLIGDNVTDKLIRNNKVYVNNLDIAIGSAAKPSTSSLYFGGIAPRLNSDVENTHVYVDNFKLKHYGKNTYFGLGAARSDATIKNSSALLNKDLNIESLGNLYAGGMVGYSKNATFENTHFQLNGSTNFTLIEDPNDPKHNDKLNVGSFAGRTEESKILRSSALLHNSYLPFAYAMDGGQLDTVANYAGDKNWKFHAGLVAAARNNRPTIVNSTYLVLADNADSIIYRTDSIAADSANNYVVVVGESEPNRIAYGIAEVTATVEEMGNSTPQVFKRNANQEVGKLNIALRKFQNKYWGKDATYYATGIDETNFAYVSDNPTNLSLKTMGTLAPTDLAKLTLANYYNRHLGIYVDKGPVYDLLGIRGIGEPKEDRPTPIIPWPIDPTPSPSDPRPTLPRTGAKLMR